MTNKETKKETKLHLGCFSKKIHGFINVDIREDVKPDVVDDICTLTKFENDSVDLIYACHVLEHLYRRDIPKVLSRWYDVLKSGGKIRIAVPDLQALFEYYICFKDIKPLLHNIYGSQKHDYDYHYSGWDFNSLKTDLMTSGFKNVQRYDWRETDHFYIDDYSQAYLPEISYRTRQIRKDGFGIKGKHVSLNVEAVK